jgi:hypothetical protein
MTIPENDKTYSLVALQANGYELKFYLIPRKNHKNSFFEAEVEFSIKPEISQQISVKSGKIKISFDDLKRLVNYLKHHMQNLQTNADEESYIFTDYNLAYQIQASCGFISSNRQESYFSITSMINIGRTNSFSNSIYVGGESAINFDRVEHFITSVENLLSF